MRVQSSLECRVLEGFMTSFFFFFFDREGFMTFGNEEVKRKIELFVN